MNSKTHHTMSRSGFLAATMVGPTALSVPLGSTAKAGGAATAPATSAIRPFVFHASKAEFTDLRPRILATKWPERETVEDASQGVNLATMKKLADYWAHHHDWSKTETGLNLWPNFITEIDGLDIHFIHVRSKHANALPVIITHGWPGSIIEQLKIIGPLTNPTAHGGTETDAFDVVIPSLPGYGFSGKPTATGWDPQRIARGWVELMRRLGYARYVAQGGDWGNAVTEQMALMKPAGLIGIHTNMPATIPDEIATTLPDGQVPAGLPTDELYAWKQPSFFYMHGLGYAQEMANRPQTLYALTDSPIGLAAWMLDHDDRSRDLITRFRRRARRTDARRHPRQHHALLVDEHRGLFRATILGEQARLLPAQGHRTAGGRQRLSRRDLHRAGKLDPQGLSEPHPLQPTSEGRAFRSLGTAAAPDRGTSRDVPYASVSVSAPPPGFLTRPLRRKVTWN
ncbi:pimeloyl-ACP methyl ester carboxylesterase [Rhizobium tibeticum]|nr:pimeloyl-ACP methyl ester carboxylesterase [Rhizobium tibeticum]